MEADKLANEQIAPLHWVLGTVAMVAVVPSLRDLKSQEGQGTESSITPRTRRHDSPAGTQHATEDTFPNTLGSGSRARLSTATIVWS